MQKSEVLKEFYVEHNYEKIIKDYNEKKDLESIYFAGKAFFMQGDLKKAKECFTKSGYFYESGYCSFLEGDLESAEAAWQAAKEDSPAIAWAKLLIEYFKGEPKHYPSFFLVRNFYENDLEQLFRFKNFAFASRMLELVHYMAYANPECYKYTARVHFNRKEYKNSLEMLNTYTKFIHKDPESYYLEARCYIELKDINHAKKSLSRCLEISENYFPALALLTDIQISL